MNSSIVLQHLNESFARQRMTFTKEDYRFLEGKSTPEGRRLGMFSLAYLKRKKLIESASIYYGYVFKDYQRVEDAKAFYPTWVLFSPHPYYQENPEHYEEMIPLLETRYAEKKKFRREKVECALHEKFADASMLPIDPSITHGRPLYLCIVYFHREHISDLHLGIYPFLANPEVSKELLYLPEQYWTKEYAESR